MASSRVTRRGNTVLGWVAPHTVEQGRHDVEITRGPSRVGSVHSVPHGSFASDRFAAIPHLVAPQSAPPTPSHCAFVRVWPSYRQLGPPPRHAQSLGSWGAEDILWRPQRLVSAEKQVAGSGRTCSFVSWTWELEVCSTTGVWKSSLTDSLCSMAPSWQWTRHSRVLSAATALPDPGHTW